MTSKLFVGGLDWNTQDGSLRAAFERFGAVTEAKVVTDRSTGRSRGFGFVTMTDPSAADTAIAELDGQLLDGRPVKVSPAHGLGPRRGRIAPVAWRAPGASLAPRSLIDEQSALWSIPAGSGQARSLRRSFDVDR